MIPTADIDIAPSLLTNQDGFLREKITFPRKFSADENKTFDVPNCGLTSRIGNSLLLRQTSNESIEPRPQVFLVSPRNADELNPCNAATKDNAKEADLVKNTREKSKTDREIDQKEASNPSFGENGETRSLNYALDSIITSSAQETQCTLSEKSTKGFFKKRGKSFKAKRKRSSTRRLSMCNESTKQRGKNSVGSKLKAKLFASTEKGNSNKELVLQGTSKEIPQICPSEPVKSNNVKTSNNAVKLPGVTRSHSLYTHRTYCEKSHSKSFLDDNSSVPEKENNTSFNRESTERTRNDGNDLPDIRNGQTSPRKYSDSEKNFGKKLDCEIFAKSISLSPRKPVSNSKPFDSSERYQNEAMRTQYNSELWDRTQSHQSLAQSNQSLNQSSPSLTQSNQSLNQSSQSLAQSKRSLTQSNQSLASSRVEKGASDRRNKGAFSVTRHESLKRQRHSTFPHGSQRKLFGGSLSSISSSYGPEHFNTALGTAKSVEVSSNYKGRQLPKSKSTPKLDFEKLREEEKERKRNQREEERRTKEIQNKRKQQQRLEIYALNKIMTELENTNFERFKEENSSVSNLPV